MDTYIIIGALIGAIIYVALAILIAIIAYATAPRNMPGPMRAIGALGIGLLWVVLALVGTVVFVIAGIVYIAVLMCGGG